METAKKGLPGWAWGLIGVGVAGATGLGVWLLTRKPSAAAPSAALPAGGAPGGAQALLPPGYEEFEESEVPTRTPVARPLPSYTTAPAPAPVAAPVPAPVAPATSAPAPSAADERYQDYLDERNEFLQEFVGASEYVEDLAERGLTPAQFLAMPPSQQDQIIIAILTADAQPVPAFISTPVLPSSQGAPAAAAGKAKTTQVAPSGTGAYDVSRRGRAMAAIDLAYFGRATRYVR